MTDTQTSGLDFIRSLMGADPPLPLMRALGFRMVEAEEGRVVFELTPTHDVYNPIGSVHGGVLATLCDSAAGCAVNTALPAGVGYTSLEIKVNFLRKVTVDTGVLRCEGTVVSVGSRTAMASAQVTDSEGRLVAHATTTCLVMRP